MRIKNIILREDRGLGLVDQHCTVKGWVRTIREQKTFAFIEMNDGSTLSNLQVVIDRGVAGYHDAIPQLSTGASLAVSGVVSQSPGKKQAVELHATDITPIGQCDPERYPLQKKRHSFEFLRTIAHLRPRTNTFGAIARVRNVLAYATHKFFQQNGFLYLNSPVITASDCEGAGEMFQVSTLDMKALPKTDEGEIDYVKDFFCAPAYLTVSGQLNAEIYSCAMSDVYTFGPTFRAENSNTSRHLAEFWMIEPEMAFADLNDDMDCAEKYLKFVVAELLSACSEEMQLFDSFISKGIIQRLHNLVENPFERITYTDAIDILLKAKKQFEFPVDWGTDLQSEHERYLTEEVFQKPAIVYDYPAVIKAFYMRQNDDEKTVASMDLLVPTVGELIGGSQREERKDKLVQKIEHACLDKEAYWWYLELREYGSVPHAGYGVGFERLVQFVTGMENIRDVIPFPRYPGHATF